MPSTDQADSGESASMQVEQQAKLPRVTENPEQYTVYMSDGRKKFQCKGHGDCSMSFTRAEHLARHMRKHTGERPYRCGCRQYFSRLDNLRQHWASAHPNRELEYEITESGVRSGLELAPGQVTPCQDEDKYLETIGVDPKLKNRATGRVPGRMRSSISGRSSGSKMQNDSMGVRVERRGRQPYKTRRSIADEDYFEHKRRSSHPNDKRSENIRPESSPYYRRNDARNNWSSRQSYDSSLHTTSSPFMTYNSQSSGEPSQHRLVKQFETNPLSDDNISMKLKEAERFTGVDKELHMYALLLWRTFLASLPRPRPSSPLASVQPNQDEAQRTPEQLPPLRHALGTPVLSMLSENQKVQLPFEPSSGNLSALADISVATSPQFQQQFTSSKQSPISPSQRVDNDVTERKASFETVDYEGREYDYEEFDESGDYSSSLSSNTSGNIWPKTGSALNSILNLKSNQSVSNANVPSGQSSTNCKFDRIQIQNLL